ncbi:transglycosylase domain-containing protein [Gottfriedia solisilvae]|uniref:Penicillin-binding protein n=1 Tax=Gottfriedia solisilvae TaxID=1516104 RepID=A0A8J3AJM6_9BACI|nr:PBP1A family penicillin-binding protein [Gottfriedia solisilvae]GGI14040.1 penicillin-binding protein [Gottfriedia solisilvae]
MAKEYRSREERKRMEKPSKGTPKKREGLLKKIILIILTCGLVGLLGVVGTFYYLISDAPKLDTKKLQVPLSSTILDKDGNVIAELGKERRTKVSYSEIPKVVEDAFLATEDIRFYKHKGVDTRRVVGAVLANITGGFGSQGGSTITQQVVKNSFLSPEKTIKRKVQEWYLAFQLEQKYSKHQILELYLNKVYFSNGLKGQGVYGIAKASERYFSKDLSEITLPEAATLAGMVQSPNNFNPAKHPKASENRRNIVLSQMKKYGYITEDQFTQSKAIPMEKLIKVQEDESVKYHSFLDVVIDEVEKNGDANVYTDGLIIETTLDTKAQDKADEIINRGKEFYPSDEFQTGFVLTDTKTGEIKAVGAGRNTTSGGLNFATDIKRQPGSTIKPVLDYGPAIQNLKWSTNHQIVDEPYQYSDGTPIRNSDKNYKGQISIREALTRSRNIPALKTIQEVGLDRSREFGNGLGFNFEKDTFYESHSIGGFTGVSAMEMAGAYAAFGNGGVYIKPHAVTRIIYQDKTEKVLTPEPKQAMSDYTAYMITDMLRDVVKSPSGTGGLANIPGLDMVGKTGTTNYPDDVKAKYGFPSNATRDSWFVGYTPDVTVSVWTGYEKNKKDHYLGQSSVKIAKYIAKDMLQETANSSSKFQKPDSVVEIRDELFIKGEKMDEVPKDELLEPAQKVTSKFDEATGNILLNWQYPSDLLPSTTFEVSYEANKVAGQTQKVQGTTATISGIVPGDIVKIKIVATSEDGKSNPVTITVDLTSVVEPTNPTDDDTQTGDDNGSGDNDDPEDDNDGIDNGNGTDDGTEDDNGDPITPETTDPNKPTVPTNPTKPTKPQENGGVKNPTSFYSDSQYTNRMTKMNTKNIRVLS